MRDGRRWIIFLAFGIYLGYESLVFAASPSMIAGGMLLVACASVTFLAGFTFRQRYVETGRRPRLRAFRRIMGIVDKNGDDGG